VAIYWDRFGRLLLVDDDTADESGPGWRPPVDIYETPDEYVVTAELAGFSLDQVRVTVEQQHVTLRGERPARRTGPAQYHRVERGQGEFARTFAFPQTIDENRIRAELRDGLLTVVLPKTNVPPTRRVRVG
jgi:HSP20 family protein